MSQDAVWRPFAHVGSEEAGSHPDLFKNPTTDLERRGAELAAELDRRAKFVRETRKKYRDAIDEYQAAQSASEREEVEAVADCRHPDPAILRAFRDASDAADEGLWQDRLHRSKQHSLAALDAYRRFVAEHGLTFAEAFKEEAEKIAREWREAREEWQQKAAPIVERYGRVHRQVQELIGGVQPFIETDIPTDYGEPPYPTPESLARYEEFHTTPTDEDAEPEPAPMAPRPAGLVEAHLF